MLGDGAPRCSSASPGASSSGTALRAAVRLHRRQRVRPARATPCCPADFVTAEDGTGLVHTAIAFGEDDFRLGEQQGLNVDQPGPARRHLRRADRAVRRPLGQGRRPGPDRGPAGARPAAASRDATSTPIRTAGAAARRCSTTPSRPGTSPRARSRTGCWPPTRRSTGTPSTSSTAASATGSRATSTGRCRASATGARRCRCGAAPHGHVAGDRLAARSCTSSPASSSSDPHRPFVDEVDVPVRRVRRGDAPRARGDRRVVRLGLDAVRPVPRAARERASTSRSASRPTSSARRSTRRAAGSTRCSPSRRCCSTARPYRNVVCLGPDPRRAGAQDVQVARQHDRAVGGDRPLRRRRAALVLLHLQAAVGRLPLLARDDRRGGPAVPAPAVEHVRVLRPVRQRERDRAPAMPARARADRARPLGPVAAAGDGRDRPRAAGRLRRDRRPAARSQAFVDELSNWYVRRSRRRFWDGDPGRVRDAARRACSTVAKLLAPFMPVHRRRDLRQPRRRRAERPPVRLPGRPASATSSSSRRWRSRARRSASGWPRAAQAKLKVRQPLRAAVVVATGAEREAIERLAEHRPRRAQRPRAAVRRPRPTSSARSRSSRTTGRSGPRFGKQMPLVAAAVAGLDPAHVAATLRDGRTVAISIGGHDHELTRRGPAGLDEAARGLPGRARGLARGRARARDRRRAAGRGLGARDRPRGPGARRRTPASRSPTGSR